jgi:hypothetical protein
MLHSFKKSVAKSTAPARGVVPNAEFAALKQSLEAVKRNITLIDKTMTDTNREWSKQIMAQRTFAEKFSEGYPISGDETSKAAAEFAAGSQTVYDYYVRHTSPTESSYHKMQQQVQVYLAEIAEVQAMYPKLKEAKSESARYSAKIDTIEKSKKTDDLKKARNLEKLDQTKEVYDETTKEVIARQKLTMGKAAAVHKLALTAYWQANEKHTQVMVASMEKTAEFARQQEVDMAVIDIANMTIEDANATLAASPAVPSITPASPSLQSEESTPTRTAVAVPAL